MAIDDQNSTETPSESPQNNSVESVVGDQLEKEAMDETVEIAESTERAPTNNAIEALINTNSVYYERLPMLEVVFDRLVRMLSTSLRNFTSDNVEVLFDGISTIRFGDYIQTIPTPAMLAVFRVEQWDNQGLVVIDSEMLYSVIDVLLGGRRGRNNEKIEERSYTTIERTLAERMIQVVLGDMHLAFDPICYVNFRFERLEINPRFAMITRAANTAILVKMRIEMDHGAGNLQLLIPYATIEPIRELLLQNFMGEKFGRDSIWENHLAEQLWHTDIELSAILPHEVQNLQSVIEWDVGTQILFDCSPDSPIRFFCGDLPLFEGYMGQKSGKVALKIDEILFNKIGGA